MAWTPGDISGAQILTDQDHLYADHINELRNALDTLSTSALLIDTNGQTWQLSVNTDGSLQTTQYFGSAPSNIILSEDGLTYIGSEDLSTYMALEAA